MGIRKQFVLVLTIGLTIGTAWGQQAPAAAPTQDPVLERYYSANALYNKKLYPLAVQEYETFLKQNPTHAKADMARFGLALSYIGAGKHAEAEPILAELGRTGKAADLDQVAVLRGQCLLRLNRMPEAEKVLKGVAEGTATKHHPAAFSALTEMSFQQNKWPDTIQWADKLLALNGKDALSFKAAYQAAYASIQLRKNDDAVQRLNTLIPKLKDDPAMASQASFLLGECCRQQGRRAEAITAYTLALTNAQPAAAAELNFRIGMTYMEMNKPGFAIDAFQQALATKPVGDMKDKITLHLGRATVENGDQKAARDVLQPLTQLNPPNAISAEASLWLARSLVRKNEAEEATKFLAKAIPQHKGQPLQADLYFDAGSLHMDARRYPEASACFTAIMDQFPLWPQTNDLWRLQAVALHHQKQYEASLKLCNNFLARFPNDPLRPEVALVRAENLFLLNRLDQAATAYQAFAAEEPAGPSVDIALFRITLIHYKTNAWDKAVTSGELFRQRQPKGDLFAPLPFLIGDAAFRLENWEQAVASLTVYLRQSTTGKEENLDTALAELGVSRLNQARTNEALQQFSALIKQFPQSRHTALALSESGRLRYERGELGPAREALETLLAGFRDAPQRPSAEYYLGWIARDEKKNDEAARRFETVATAYTNDPKSVDAALQRGLLYLAMEQYPKAQTSFEQLLQRYPNHPRADLALFSRGIALARSRQWQNAATVLKQYRDKYPKAENADRALYELAWCEKGMKRPAEAGKYYQALIDGYPRSELVIKSRTEMSELSVSTKDFDKTIADLIRALDEVKDNTARVEVMYRLGMAYFNKGDWANSADVFEQFRDKVFQSPLLASACFQAGEARLRLNQPTNALAHFVTAVTESQGSATAKQAEDPKVHEAALLRLGDTYGLLGQWADEERVSAQFLRQYPKSPYVKLVTFNNGWALENLKRYEEAIKQFQAVVAAKERNVLSARCQFHIGECLYGLRRYDEALVELVKVETNYGQEEWSAKAALEVGRVLEAKGDTAKALGQFKDVIKRFPKQDAAKTAKERLDGIRMSQ